VVGDDALLLGILQKGDDALNLDSIARVWIQYFMPSTSKSVDSIVTKYLKREENAINS